MHRFAAASLAWLWTFVSQLPFEMRNIKCMMFFLFQLVDIFRVFSFLLRSLFAWNFKSLRCFLSICFSTFNMKARAKQNEGQAAARTVPMFYSSSAILHFKRCCLVLENCVNGEIWENVIAAAGNSMGCVPHMSTPQPSSPHVRHTVPPVTAEVTAQDHPRNQWCSYRID